MKGNLVAATIVLLLGMPFYIDVDLLLVSVESQYHHHNHHGGFRGGPGGYVPGGYGYGRSGCKFQ